MRYLHDDTAKTQPENYLKNAEMALEDDYGMIDGIINNGPKQTVAEQEERSSIPAKLKAPVETTNRTENTRPSGAQKRSYDMNFTNDEMNLMCMYNTGSRESLMRELREMRGCIGVDQPELLAMTDSTLQKLEKISDVDFAELALYPDF